MLEISEYTYRDLLSGTDNIIIYCWADWCVPCRTFNSVYEAASKEHTGVVFTKLNVDEQSSLARELNLKGIPSILFYKKAHLMDSIMGSTTVEDISNRIKTIYG